MSRKMQKPRLAPRFLQQERGEEKMKKIIWNRLSVLYPKDIKEEREKVLSWYEVRRGNPPGEKDCPADGQRPGRDAWTICSAVESWLE